MMAKGFGQPQAIPTRNATKFMAAFAKCYAEFNGDEKKVQQFLVSHLKQLNESLLDALPLIADKLASKSGDREGVSVLLNAYGESVSRLKVGVREFNIELGLRAYQAALLACKHSHSQKQWAATQNNIGNAYLNRIRGDRAENLDQAIFAYELALQVRTPYAFPRDWAGTQSNLGTAYHWRICGDRAENLEQAIKAFQLALKVFTRQTLPKDWAVIQCALGTLYADRIRGDRAENLEQAIKAFQLALQVFTRQTFPKDWAGTQNNLGKAYRLRIRGDRSENLEQAIKVFDIALQVYTRAIYPEFWAVAQDNLGDAYRDRIQGQPNCNLKTAIDKYQQAAQILTRDNVPLAWVRNRGHLAEALMKQAEFANNLEDLNTAISLLQETLEVAVPGSPDFIDSQYRLGTALSRRFEQNQDPRDLQQALKAYKTALDAISPEHYDRTKIWQALPATQSVLGSRLVREGEWQEGLQLLLNSVRLLREGDDPLAHANTLYQTARAHETLSDWGNARLYYRDALRLYDHLKDEPGIAKSRHGLGSVLVSQGYLAKGMSELQKALNLYQQLERPDKVAEVESLYQTVQQAEQHMQKVAI